MCPSHSSGVFFALHEMGDKVWYHVTYERLPLFCFLCGIISHSEIKCHSRFDEDFAELVGEFPYAIGCEQLVIGYPPSAQ